MERFIQYQELIEFSEKERRPYELRMPLLHTACFFLTRANAVKLGIRFDDGIMPQNIIFAVEPNSGKPYLGNVYSVISGIHHLLYEKTSGVLRVTNEEDNANNFNKQIMGMITNPIIVSIFPELKKYFIGDRCRIFKSDKISAPLFEDLPQRITTSYFALTIGGSMPSKRAYVAIILDDISGGIKECKNDDIHKQQAAIVFNDILSRKESQDVPFIGLGTLYNEYCYQLQMIKRLENEDKLIDFPNLKYVRCTRDYKTIIIQIPALDENEQSVAPKLISTEDLIEIKKSNEDTPYIFDLMYMQKRASRIPRIFDYKYIKTYSKLPEESTFSNATYMTIDPTRKSGNDFFSAPCFKYNNEHGLYYFIDCIFENSSLGKPNDPNNKFLKKLIDFIISNRVTNLYLENNIDVTLSAIIQEKLNQRGYKNCKIEEVYNIKRKGKENKLQRILSQEETIKRNIVFPSYLACKNIDCRRFMDYFTRFDSKDNIGKKTNPDDAPDSVAMFSDKYIFGVTSKPNSLNYIEKSKIWS